METFAPGDRVVAINTDLSAPILPPVKGHLHSFSFPDGPLRRGVVYHVAAVRPHSGNAQGVFITGSRVMWGPHEIPWHFSRFRKVDNLKDYLPRKRRRKKPVQATRRATCPLA